MRLATPEISWHGKFRVLSVDFASNDKLVRLATSGDDSNVRIWSILSHNETDSKVEFLSNLSRHTKAVNVVRFAPEGNILASGGDDCYVILWMLSEKESELCNKSMNNEDMDNKEFWRATKILRGHIEDVLDIAWSPNASQLISGSVDNSVIIWDVIKGEKMRMLTDHRQYVQGVCWDPCGSYIASCSSDRTCRIYSTSNYRRCYTISQVYLPNNSPDGTQTTRQMKIFHDETILQSFFRRLTFSPEGSLLFVPAGRFEANEKVVNATYVFTKASLNKPVMYFPALKKPTIAVRCCPTLFQLRNSEVKGEKNGVKTVFKLPYRIVIAVASLDSVALYDTQRLLPFAFLSNMHYENLTDIAWSNNGKFLAISSSDGYCSLVTFHEKELGEPYLKAARETIENAKVLAGNAPVGKNISHAQTSKTSAFTKEENVVSPKIEKLSIKNFMTVKPSRMKTNCAGDDFSSVCEKNEENVRQEAGRTAPLSGSGSLNTIKPIYNLSCKKDEAVSTLVTKPLQDTSPTTHCSTTATKLPRRVNFVTLQPSPVLKEMPTEVWPVSKKTENTEALIGDPRVEHMNIDMRNVDPKTTENNCENISLTTTNLSAEETKMDGICSTSLLTPQPVTIKTVGNSDEQHHNQDSKPSTSIQTTTSPERPSRIQPKPRRVSFITLKSTPNSSPPNNQNVNGHPFISPPMTHSICTDVNHVSQETTPPQVVATVDESSTFEERNYSSRPSKHPVPLEPEVIILN